MSVDAGGLAHMTYQTPFNGTIGVSRPGFGTRGKATHVKSLSVAPPSNISTIDEGQKMNTVATPRTSRIDLLHRLRTEPKSATVASSNSGMSLENSRFASIPLHQRTPQTTTAASFPADIPFRNGHNSLQGYSSTQQVLALPTFVANLTPDVMEQYLYHNIAQQRQKAQEQWVLQQQLINLQQAAEQQGAIYRNGHHNGNMQPTSNLDSQQYLQSLNLAVHPVPGYPGWYAVQDQTSGVPRYVFDETYQQQTAKPPTSHSRSPPPSNSPQQRRSPDSTSASNGFRSGSTPKSTPSPPQDFKPLPPPSDNAFRRGHKKNLSSVNVKTTGDWSRNAGPKSAGIVTPMTGTFGPGQGRAGEHPEREPHGPPSLQELQDKPTAKHEGSKNFAKLARKSAVHDLVRAGRERTANRQPSSGTGNPVSEAPSNFSSSDNDELMARSTSLSSKPSLGSIRAACSGAIGSERKEKSRERASVDGISGCSTKSLSSDDGISVGGQIVEVENSRRRAPLFVLSSAEKRKSSAM